MNKKKRLIKFAEPDIASLYFMANRFSQQKLQKRVTMMTQERTNAWGRLRWMMAVPVMMGAAYLFAQPEVNEPLEALLPTSVEQRTDDFQSLEQIKSFFRAKQKAYMDATSTEDSNGKKVHKIKESQVHFFRVNKRNQIMVGGDHQGEREFYLKDLTQTHTLHKELADFLREVRKEREAQLNASEPQCLVFIHDKDSDPDSLFSYLKQAKLAFDDLRQEYPQDGNLDIACPYWLYPVEVDEYHNFVKLANVELTLFAQDGKELHTLNDFSLWFLRDYLDELPKGTVASADIKPSPKASRGTLKGVTDVLRKYGVLKVNRL